MGELVNLIPKMTSNTTPSGIVTASHEYDPAWRAFDHSTTNGTRPFWYASSTAPVGGHWIQYKFNEHAFVDKIAIQTGVISGSNYGVKDFKILGSVDGVDFVEIFSGTHQNNASRTEYILNNKEGYLYYRLQGNSYYGANVLITELEMYGGFKPPSTNKILLLSGDGKQTKIEKSVINLIPHMTSNTSPKGIVDASGFRTTGTEPWRAFNGIYTGDSNEAWQANARTGWLSYEFDKEVTIEGYSLKGRSDVANMSPVDWVFEAYDNSEWIILDKVVGENWSDYNGEFKRYKLNNTEAYKKFRINITKNNGNVLYVCIAEMQINLFSNVSINLNGDFINHGMSPQELSEIDFSSNFTEKHYIQNQSTSFGSGKVFEQSLDVDKTIKNVKIT